MNGERHDKDMEREGQTSPKVSVLGVGLALFLAAAAFFSGLQVGDGPKLEASLASIFGFEQAHETVDSSEFWRVWGLLDEKFVNSTSTDLLTDEEKIQGAIKGLVNAYGDPYTVFLPPADTEIFEDDISGNFGGVGMEIGIRDDLLTVITPLPDTPAELAGIQSGDAIIRIDGVTAENMSIDEAVKLIRGEKGTAVELVLFREGAEEFIEVSVVRGTITIPTIETESRDGVFVIRLFNFSAMSEALMQGALRDFVQSGDRKLIIDVRGNPGGFLQSAVNISSYFLPTGKVVVREDFGGEGDERVYRSSGKDLQQFTPSEIVILINGGSASASEILAGALREHDVATLIGTQTFGKGSVQELIDLDSGSSVKITIARWLTPNGISISDAGLEPDIEIEFTLEDREAGLDPQLDAAIEFLNRK